MGSALIHLFIYLSFAYRCLQFAREQVLPLENEMKNPKKFGSPLGVLNASLLPITFLYMFVGLFGYLKYGQDTTGSITLDLPQTEV